MPRYPKLSPKEIMNYQVILGSKDIAPSNTTYNSVFKKIHEDRPENFLKIKNTFNPILPWPFLFDYFT